MKTLRAPLTPADVKGLRQGEWVLFSGAVYTARDAAHKRLIQLLENDKPLPFPLEGSAIFYAGPCPAPPGRVIGSVGPTTGGRMDGYSLRLMREGFHVMIGKGPRSPEVAGAIRQTGCAYLSAVGGAAALTARCIAESELIAFGELGTEAVYRLTVRDLPLIVTNV